MASKLELKEGETLSPYRFVRSICADGLEKNKTAIQEYRNIADPYFLSNAPWTDRNWISISSYACLRAMLARYGTIRDCTHTRYTGWRTNDFIIRATECSDFQLDERSALSSVMARPNSRSQNLVNISNTTAILAASSRQLFPQLIYPQLVLYTLLYAIAQKTIANRSSFSAVTDTSTAFINYQAAEQLLHEVIQKIKSTATMSAEDQTHNTGNTSQDTR